MKKYAVVFLAWGDKYIKEVESCLEQSRAIQEYDHILITDKNTKVEHIYCKFTKIMQVDFDTQGLLRKTEIIKFLPDTYEAYLFLDSDTLVLEEISLGFEKAEIFSIAASPAPHYSLDHFWGFDKIMKSESISLKGQLQYNTGVIFFKNSKEVKSVFKRWMLLALKYQNKFENDQPFFSLAMEQLNLNPYTLSISYNYRGFGNYISGLVRIWHSHGEVPKKINEYKVSWPPRRAWPSKMIYQNQVKNDHPMNFFEKVKHKIKQLTLKKCN